MNPIAALAFLVAGYTLATVAPGSFPYFALIVCVAICIANLGWLPSKSYTVHRQVEVHGSSEDVFWYLADFRNASEWDPNVASSERYTHRTTASDEARRGDVFYLVTLWKGRQSGMRYELTSLQSCPKAGGSLSFELRGHTGDIMAHDQVRVQPAANAQHQRPKASVSYTLTVTITGWKGYFIRLIARDLEALGTESIAGLVKTCKAKWQPITTTTSASAGAAKRRRNSRGP